MKGLEWVILGLLVLLILIVIYLLFKINKINNNDNDEKLKDLKNEIDKALVLQNTKIDYLTSSINEKFNHLSETLKLNLDNNSEKVLETKKSINQMFSELKEFINQSFISMNSKIEERLNYLTTQTEQKLTNISNNVTDSIRHLQDENSKKLNEIKNTVDEKLQKTLEDKLAQSFSMVSENLEKVYKGLGEMQNLASGVGDLKKVLSNVKTRGILGEIQLGNILEQILSPEQYDTNVVTKKGTNNPVEFAIKLPGDGNEPVYLPIDAKFPLEDYQALLNSYDNGSQEEVSKHLNALIRKIKSFAKDINDKYIDAPNTTDFAIMFLPVEGLYAEVVKSGVIEELQRDYKINISGPTTMAALLNSLQMGFKTLAIQKRSSEVWKILSAVKTEFNTFGDVLASTQKKIIQVSDDLDKLVGVRTRKIQSKLKSVTELPEIEAKVYLPFEEE